VGITTHHGNYQLSMTNDDTNDDDDDDDLQINYMNNNNFYRCTRQMDRKTTHTPCDPPDDFRNVIFSPPSTK